MEKNDVTYYKSANWAFVRGNFTPDELRKIAKEIEAKHKRFQGFQKKTKK